MDEETYGLSYSESTAGDVNSVRIKRLLFFFVRSIAFFEKAI